MKMDSGQQKFIFYTVGGILVYQIALKPMLEALNIKDTKEEANAKKLQAETESLPVNLNYWNPNYYKQLVGGKKAMVFTQASGDNLAKALKNAAGIFNDDEEAIFGVFNQCRYKAQVSYIAARFYALYKLDLYTWLRDGVLSKNELATVLNITSKLPTGFIV